MKNIFNQNSLFDKQGYILLREYLEDINYMRKFGPWKVPLGQRDRFLLFFLTILVKFSWFFDTVYIKYSYSWSPSYSLIITYLIKRKIIDNCFDRPTEIPGFFSFVAVKQFSQGEDSRVLHSNGIAQDKATSLSKAIGEIIERNTTGLLDATTNIIRSSSEILREEGRIFYPPKFHRFLLQQKQLSSRLNIQDSEIIDWVVGRDMLSQEKVYIPKHITSWLLGMKEGGKLFINPTTNGSALAFNEKDASIRAILEVIQRDSFFVHWLTGTAPQRVDVSTLPFDVQETINEFKERGVTIYVVNTTTNIPIPSICIVGISHEALIPAVTISASSAFTFDDAVRDGLREMVLCSQSLSGDVGPSDAVKPFVSNLDKSTRLSYWRGQERINQCTWFLSGEAVSFDSLLQGNLVAKSSYKEGKLEILLNVLQEMGKDYHPILYKPTNRVQKDLGCYIVQVFIPKAFPLYLVEKYGTFDSDRLSEFALYKNKKDWTLTKIPHMFV